MLKTQTNTTLLQSLQQRKIHEHYPRIPWSQPRLSSTSLSPQFQLGLQHQVRPSLTRLEPILLPSILPKHFFKVFESTVFKISPVLPLEISVFKWPPPPTPYPYNLPHFSSNISVHDVPMFLQQLGMYSQLL